MIGVRSYGSAIPKNRIKALDILAVWKNTTPEVLESTGQTERCVTRPDEDTLTLSFDAATRTIKSADINPKKIDTVLFGSGTGVYTTKANATFLQDALGISNAAFVTDIQFSGKSGTTALRLAYSLIKAQEANNVLVVAADTLNLHIPPGHYYEYSASAGATAFIISNESVIAEFEGFSSYSSDRNEWFRLDAERYLQCGGGFIGYRANWGLLEHVVPAATTLMEKLTLSPADFNHVAVHQGTIPQIAMVMGSLKLPPANVFPWTLTRKVGDIGAASSLLAFANILDHAGPNERTLITSWGWGSGADAFSTKTTERISDRRSKPSVKDLLANKQYINYDMALKYEGKLLRSFTDSHAYL